MSPNEVNLSEPTHGFFITFEGVDGCGKTTQVQLLAQVLQALWPHRTIIVTKNPGGTPFGLQLRSILLETGSGSEHTPLVSDAEVLLYMADRAQHVQTVLKPALEQGAIVICDRFGDSTLAYQGYGRGLELPWLSSLHKQVCQGVQPNLTFLLDAPLPLLLERLDAGRNGYRDRIEQEGVAFLQRVQEGFLTLSEEDPVRIQVISAKPSPEAVHHTIINTLALCLKAASQQVPA